jgi:hypothetical protein
MPLTEQEFTALVDAGCSECVRPRLSVLAVVAQKLPLLKGEPYGAPSWGYKGEELVRGTYLIACEGCKKELFRSNVCPRCDAAAALERALTTENDFPLPESCRSCGSELLVARAFVPARVIYERKRAQKAHAEACPEEPGFHAFRVECTRCHAVEERSGGCPVCGPRG